MQHKEEMKADADPPGLTPQPFSKSQYKKTLSFADQPSPDTHFCRASLVGKAPFDLKATRSPTREKEHGHIPTETLRLGKTEAIAAAASAATAAHLKQVHLGGE